ncbi:MAG TPA: UDP-N-acetylmuramate dehydrogenase [Burkholderiaceae bacterium]|jgi:UDP-N-acetylmuramate dehydrogenase|nr:UDP-N-acetylmuramate dehydrogenase [Burkholderiaceae bacterium]
MRSLLPIQHRVSLRRLNTFGVEAFAHAYLKLTDPLMLQEVKNDPVLSKLPRLVLGGGSNILLTSDFSGLVLHMDMRGIEVLRQDEVATYIRVAAGENWHQFVLWTLAHGFGGLENLSLIPGSVGAAPIQNIGAYGVEVKDFIESVDVFDFASGEMMTLTRDECAFAYRDSIFKRDLRDRAVIVNVIFGLPKNWQSNTRYIDVAQELQSRAIATPSAQDISNAVIAIRQRKLPDPAVIGNAGSFFKNPLVPALQRNALLEQNPQLVSYLQADGSYKLAAGWLIDQCGWKGRSLGAAGVYEKQALVLVNHGGAQGNEIWQLAQAIQADVMARFEVKLEAEPVLI